MTRDTDPADGVRVVRWTLLCAFGLAAGLAVGLGVARPIQAVVGMMLVTPLVLSLSGSVLGLSQSLSFRWPRSARLSWVGATAVGLGLGMTIGVVIVETAFRALTGGTVRMVALSPGPRFAGLAAVGAITGLALGAVQYLAMRRRVEIRARWILVSTLAFAAGLSGGGLAADVLVGGLRSATGFGTFLVAAGLIVGLATARSARRVAAATSL